MYEFLQSASFRALQQDSFNFLKGYPAKVLVQMTAKSVGVAQLRFPRHLNLNCAHSLLQNSLSVIPNIHVNASVQILTSIRRSVIDMVLSTDMKQHFSIMSMFGTKFNSGDSAGVLSAHGSTDGGGTGTEARMHMGSNALDEEARALALQVS
jgi:membrane protease subunit (stomatin/prohibitin family)